MKPLRSILTAGLALAMFSTTALRAETFPIFEDAAGSTITNAISKASGAAKTLAVSAKSNAYINFSVGSSGIAQGTVTGARLVIYLPKASATGTLSIRNLASAFTESFTTKTIPAPTVGATLDTIDLAQIPLHGDYFISDITAQVQAWLSDPGNEFGIAITSDGVATATLASKEGAASGHPAFIEVDVIPSSVNVGQVSAGSVFLNSYGLTFPGSNGSYDSNLVGTTGNLIAFGDSTASTADTFSYKNNTFYFENSPFGPESNPPDLVVGGGITGNYLANSNATYRFANGVNVGTGGINFLKAFNGNANPAFVGTQGNFLSFAHQGVSEDCISYANNTFYFRDTPDGGDASDPNVDIGGGTLIANSATIATNVAINSVLGASAFPLDVNGFKGQLPGAGRFFDINSNLTTNGSSQIPISIHASHAILASGFTAGSDARIKTIRGHSSSAADLSTLRGIEITDYVFKDAAGKGARPQKKVIAQQVEKIFPQAVSLVTDVVPDIYTKAPEREGWITLATDLKVGERVRLIGEKEEGIYKVLEVRDDAFRTAFQPAGDEVFVYGREVADFRTVDYEAISMLNVSATQELARKLDAKDAQIAALTAKLAVLEARDQEREARLARLEGAAAPARVTTAALQLK